MKTLPKASKTFALRFEQRRIPSSLLSFIFIIIIQIVWPCYLFSFLLFLLLLHLLLLFDIHVCMRLATWSRGKQINRHQPTSANKQKHAHESVISQRCCCCCRWWRSAGWLIDWRKSRERNQVRKWLHDLISSCAEAYGFTTTFQNKTVELLLSSDAVVRREGGDDNDAQSTSPTQERPWKVSR